MSRHKKVEKVEVISGVLRELSFDSEEDEMEKTHYTLDISSNYLQVVRELGENAIRMKYKPGESVRLEIKVKTKEKPVGRRLELVRGKLKEVIKAEEKYLLLDLYGNFGETSRRLGEIAKSMGYSDKDEVSFEIRVLNPDTPKGFQRVFYSNNKEA